jgi:hypothetical protein
MQGNGRNHRSTSCIRDCPRATRARASHYEHCPDSSGELSTLDLPVVLFLLARAHGWHCHEHASMGFNFRKGLAVAFDWLVEAPRNSDFVNTSLRSVTASAAGV